MNAAEHRIWLLDSPLWPFDSLLVGLRVPQRLYIDSFRLLDLIRRPMTDENRLSSPLDD